MNTYTFGRNTLIGIALAAALFFVSPAISLAAAPSVQTMTESHTATTATLGGYFNGNGKVVQTAFEWGLSQNNLPYTTGFTNQPDMWGNFSDTISGLSPDTTYYFRAVARNADGTTKAQYALPFKTSTATTGGGACTITSFTASPDTIVSGSTANLSWQTSGCDSWSISPNIGAVTGSSNSVSTPALSYSTYYTLTAYQNGYPGIAKKQVGVLVTTGGSGTGGTGGPLCTINYFTVSPTEVQEGGASRLSWQTTGCTSVTISGGPIASSSDAPTGSVVTGKLYGTTTYTLFAHGSQTTNESQTVYVTGSQYQYSYICSDGVDNDGDSRIDYPNDLGCTSTYDNDEFDSGNNNAPNTARTEAITTAATNIGGSSARLNGLVVNPTKNTTAFFEYGTSTALGKTSSSQNIGDFFSQATIFETIETKPNTTYFYRAVTTSGTSTVRGGILSFKTSASTTDTFVSGSGTKNGKADATVAGVVVTVTTDDEKANVGEIVKYTVTYKNGTSQTITKSILTFVVPQGFMIRQTTEGSAVSPSTVQVDIGTLTAGQTGSIYVEATVDANVRKNETLVSTATLSYTLPNGQRDSAVGYILTKVGGSAALGGLALGSGFFPSTIFGWFMMIIIILAIILAARRFTKKKEAHGHADHGGHH